MREHNSCFITSHNTKMVMGDYMAGIEQSFSLYNDIY